MSAWLTVETRSPVSEITLCDSLVEELAQFLAQRRTGLPWKDMTEQGRDHWRDTARGAIRLVVERMDTRLAEIAKGTEND